MRLSIPQYAQALLELEKEGDAVGTASRFFAWLSCRGEGKKMKKIIGEADRIFRLRSGITDIVITTAHDADTAMKESLLREARAVFAGKRIEARFVTDADVIGGAKFRSDSLLFDATLSTAVRKLKTVLSR